MLGVTETDCGVELLLFFSRYVAVLGGSYLGICAGAYFALHWFDFLAICESTSKSGKNWMRGSALLDIEFDNADPALVADVLCRSQEFEHKLSMRYTNGPLFEPLEDIDTPNYSPIMWFRSEVNRCKHSVRGQQIDSPAAVRGNYGKGSFVLFSPHPESQHFSIVSSVLSWLCDEHDKSMS